MTCREKLKIEHPEKIDEKYYGGCKGCPKSYNYLDNPSYCPGKTCKNTFHDSCRRCWNREIPDIKPTPTEQEPTTEPTNKTSSIPSMTDLQWLMRKALGYPGIAVSITFMEDVITFNAYPYPTQEEETNESR